MKKILETIQTQVFRVFICWTFSAVLRLEFRWPKLNMGHGNDGEIGIMAKDQIFFLQCCYCLSWLTIVFHHNKMLESKLRTSGLLVDSLLTGLWLGHKVDIIKIGIRYQSEGSSLSELQKYC